MSTTSGALLKQPDNQEMICPRCSRKNGETSLFCAGCGVFLHPNPTLQELVSALKNELGDRELIEKASALAVIDKVWGWLKILGGVAAALLLLASFIVGLQIRDLSGAYKEAKALVDQTEARTKALLEKVSKLGDNLDKVPQLRTDVDKLSKEVDALRPSSVRPSIKYREPDETTSPRTVTVNELFSWPAPEVPPNAVKYQNRPVDERENSVIRITGDIYAAAVDGTTGTLRVLIQEPGLTRNPDQTVILAIPDPTVAAKEGVKNSRSYADAQAALLAAIGKKREQLPKAPAWDFPKDFGGSRSVTATGHPKYNESYASRSAQGARIGVWQVSPVWRVGK